MAMNSEMEQTAAEILRLGDPRLRQASAPVAEFRDPAFLSNQRRLHSTLVAFRQANGFGRAISAPQIGVPQRFIAMNLGVGPLLLVNPEIVWTSSETFTMWDDCMSFPTLLVRLQRHKSISIHFSDDQGKTQEWTRLDQATSELLQHEIDHLDGILAVDRALDRESLVLREVFEAQRAHFIRQVDYVIAPAPDVRTASERPVR
jgi:peptide deformylase